jgi:hypothetical protein
MAVSRSELTMTASSSRRSGGLREALPRIWPSILAGATALVIVGALAWRAGGYFPPSYLAAGMAAFGVLGVLLIVRAPAFALSTSALVAIGSLCGLAAWTGLSTRWSPSPDSGLEAMQLTAAYVGIFGLGLLAAGSGRLSRHLVWGVLGVIVLVCGAGLLSRIYPNVVSSLPPGEFVAYRLAHPLGYWNAFGALAAVGIVLSLGLAADPRGTVYLRSAAAGACLMLFVAMYLSFSRGAWLATIVGLVVLTGLSPRRGSLLLSAANVGVFGVLALGRLDGYPALTDNPHAGGGQVSAGDAYGPQLLVLIAIVVGVQVALSLTGASPRIRQTIRHVGIPLRAAALAVAVVVGLGVYAVKAASVEGHSAGALTDAHAWVNRQWDEFNSPSAFSATGTARLTSAKGTRSDVFRVAIDAFKAAPLVGHGAGSFEVDWMRHRRVDEKVHNAHSLYLETAGELGLVGSAFLLLFLGSIIVAAVRARLRPVGMSRSQAAAVCGAVAVWLFHAGVDWDWQMPALTGPVLILAATAFPQGRRVRGRRRRKKAKTGNLSRSVASQRLG